MNLPNNKDKMIISVLKDSENVENLINTLNNAGYDAKDISIIVKNKKVSNDLNENLGINVFNSATSGIFAGAGIGALTGLLIGIGALTIPGVGSVLIGGPLAASLGLTGAASTTMSGAITGGLAGGLVGSLIGLGIPQEEAKSYKNKVEKGAYLALVPVREGGEEEDVINILNSFNAEQIKSLNISTDKENYDLKKDEAIQNLKQENDVLHKELNNTEDKLKDAKKSLRQRMQELGFRIKPVSSKTNKRFHSHY